MRMIKDILCVAAERLDAVADVGRALVRVRKHDDEIKIGEARNGDGTKSVN